MNTFKKLFCVALVLGITLTAACSKQEKYIEKKVVEIKQSPEYVVDTTLKNLRGNNFKDVRYFGGFNHNNIGGKLFYNAIFDNLTYSILASSENEDGTYTVDVEITNYDLSEIPTINELKGMDKYKELTTFELQNLVINTIDELEETATNTVSVILAKGSKGYNITNKTELYKVASGGYLGK